MTCSSYSGEIDWMQHKMDIATPNTSNQPLPLQEQSDWIISMKDKLKEASRYDEVRPWQKWCIYRVPRRLRDAQVDGKVYTPQTVSIGPYNNEVEQVHDMDRQKWVALHRIQQEYIRNFSSNKFVEMIVLDGCFILEIFQCSPKVGWRSNPKGDPVFSNQNMIDDILIDMVLLENQIPLFILDRLLGLISLAGNHRERQEERATTLALNLFSPEWLTGKSLTGQELNEMKSSLQQQECLHILDVFRRSLLHGRPQKVADHRHRFWWRVQDNIVPRCVKQWLNAKRSQNRVSMHGQVIYNVTELREAGVKFRIRNTNCFWDIKFKNGVLEIPTIWIHGCTKSILLNVSAFEHCHLEISEAVIAAYVVFMACLIKIPEDVSYLHRRGIIQHLLGSDAAVVEMFKSISTEMLIDPHSGYYAELSERVNAYYNRRRHKWRASLVHKYLYNPWAIISVAAAVILLLLTSIQTFYAVYSYYRQKP